MATGSGAFSTITSSLTTTNYTATSLTSGTIYSFGIAAITASDTNPSTYTVTSIQTTSTVPVDPSAGIIPGETDMNGYVVSVSQFEVAVGWRAIWTAAAYRVLANIPFR